MALHLWEVTFRTDREQERKNTVVAEATMELVYRKAMEISKAERVLLVGIVRGKVIDSVELPESTPTAPKRSMEVRAPGVGGEGC